MSLMRFPLGAGEERETELIVSEHLKVHEQVQTMDKKFST